MDTKGDRAYLLVDGYNIIHSWPELEQLQAESLEHAREALIHILSDYAAFTGQQAVIVFDAHLVKGTVEQREKVTEALEVVYTREGETADMFIERMVSFLLPGSRVIQVATSDSVEQQVVWREGALRLSSRDLRDLVQAAGKERRVILASDRDPGNPLDAYLDMRLRAEFEKWRRQ